jgi:hypothetical protein
MNQVRYRRAVLCATSALAMAAIAVAIGGAGSAAGATPQRLKVTCDQMTDAIRATAATLAAQYTAQGFTPDAVGSYERCTKLGKRARQGKGYIHDIRYSGDPPFPGESNPDVSEYDWTWFEVVTRTKKGKLRGVISNLACEKVIGTGSSAQFAPC